jgi:hypothetical protein
MNMIPITQATNMAMRDGPETTVRNYLYRDRSTGPGLVHYQVRVDYGGHDVANISGPERLLPNRVSVRAEIHQGPSNRGTSRNLAEWQDKDAAPLCATNHNMALANFALAYPTPQLTGNANATGTAAVNNFANHFPGLSGQTMAPIGMLHSAIAAENETHPNERLTALTDRLNNEAHRLQPVKDALRAKLIEVWHCTSFHQQHPDEAELGRLAGQLSFAGLTEPYENLDQRALLSAPSMRAALTALAERFFDWMVAADQSMPQGPRDAAVDAWINTQYQLADGPVNARYAALSVQLRGQVTHYMAAIGAADSVFDLADAINSRVFDRFIPWDKHLQALWTGSRRSLT